MALDVKYLRGTPQRYAEYLAAGFIVDTNFYYIVDAANNKADLYLGKIKLSNGEDLKKAIDSLVGKYGADEVIPTIRDLDNQLARLLSETEALKEGYEELEELVEELLNQGGGGGGISNTVYTVEGQNVFGKDEEAIAAAVSRPRKNDMAVVTNTVNDVVYRTAYYYTGTNWAAMEGNYNAENVYFNQDLVSTYSIGNISLTNGQGSVKATGKNLLETWNLVFQKETAPTIVPVSASLSAGPDQEVEIGTLIDTITWDGTFSSGSYSFGSVDLEDNSIKYADTDTGIGEADWNVSYVLEEAENGIPGDSTEATTIDGSFKLNTPFQVNALTSKKYATVNAEVSWSDSPRSPINNLGAQVEGRLLGDTKSLSNAVQIRGFRKMWYGTFEDKKDELVSSDFRESSLTSRKAATGEYSITIPLNAMRVVVAVPTNLSLVKVLDTNDSNANIVGSFKTDKALSIEGAEGFAATDYNLYYLDYANPNDAVNKYIITIN